MTEVSARYAYVALDSDGGSTAAWQSTFPASGNAGFRVRLSRIELEIATKNYLGKLPGVEILLEQFEMRMADDGITLLDITLRHSIAAGQLRGSHKDPFDRILAAQAWPRSLTLLSNDTALDTFGVHRIW